MTRENITIRVSIRFYASLNDLLPYRARQNTLSLHVPRHNTVKHLVESLGVPHTEIDLILVNGVSVPFSCIPNDGDHISVYPMFTSLDISPLLRLRSEPLCHPRFILDTHLGKLAVFLRMLGFDSLYRNDFEDSEIANLACKEERIILTRDRGLLKRSIV